MLRLHGWNCPFEDDCSRDMETNIGLALSHRINERRNMQSPGLDWCLRCVVLSALGPSSIIRPSAHSKQAADQLDPAFRDNRGRVPFRAEFSYGDAHATDAGGRQSGRTSRPL